MNGLDEEVNVAHKFNLNGFKLGEWFIGCKECWFQYPKSAIGAHPCPVCSGKMYSFKVTQSDIDSGACQ